jgi:hypothetical protein
LVVLLGDPNRPHLALVVELQLEVDPDKPPEWAKYKVDARAHWRCPGEAWIIAPDPEVARWASQPIDIGPRIQMSPLVQGSEEFPEMHLEDLQGEPSAMVLCALLQCRGREDVSLLKKVLFRLAFLSAEACIGFLEILRRHLSPSFTQIPEVSRCLGLTRDA